MVPSAVPGGGAPAFFVTSVLSGLGLCMLVAGLLVRLPSAALLALSLGAVVTTHLVTPSPADARALYAPLTRLLVLPGHTERLLVVYPVLPWLAAVLPGMVLGRILLRRGAEAYPVAFAALFYFAHLLLFAVVGLAIGPAGIGAPAMLPIWIVGVAALYPASRWYDRFKRSTAPDSPWRLF